MSDIDKIILYKIDKSLLINISDSIIKKFNLSDFVKLNMKNVKEYRKKIYFYFTNILENIEYKIFDKELYNKYKYKYSWFNNRKIK